MCTKNYIFVSHPRARKSEEVFELGYISIPRFVFAFFKDGFFNFVMTLLRPHQKKRNSVAFQAMQAKKEANKAKADACDGHTLTPYVPFAKERRTCTKCGAWFTFEQEYRIDMDKLQ